VTKLDVAYIPECKIALDALHQIEAHPFSQAVRKVIERGQKVKHHKQEGERPLGRRNPNPLDTLRCGIREFDRENRELMSRTQALQHAPMATAYRVSGYH